MCGGNQKVSIIMTDDILLKTIEELMDKKIQPVKELVEVIDHKVRRMEMFQGVAAEQVRAIRDQQSVFNKKLDDMKKTSDGMKETLDEHTKVLKQHTRIMEDQLLPSVITIEDTIRSYGDMYKINGDNIKRHEVRLTTVEDKLGITINPDLKHVDLRDQL